MFSWEKANSDAFLLFFIVKSYWFASSTTKSFILENAFYFFIFVILRDDIESLCLKINFKIIHVTELNSA